MAIPINMRSLTCVEYPGRVKNVDKMLETLGGEENVSKAACDSSRRLDLRFRPGDPYCRPVYGDRFPTSSLLLRVTRRRRVRKNRTKGSDEDAAPGSSSTVTKETPAPSAVTMETPAPSTVTMETQAPSTSASTTSPPEEERVTYNTEVLGIVDTTYRFQAMADFQYLPLHRTPDGRTVQLYDQLLLGGLEGGDFYQKDVPLFVPPATFSRIDTPQNYHYKKDPTHNFKNPMKALSSSNLIGVARARRPHNAIFVNFEELHVPTKPLDGAVVHMDKYNLHGELEELTKLFQERPIWSRNALQVRSGIRLMRLKLLLPLCGYYAVTGPWRSLWVKFGYDPRKDPTAKQYQLLDFRVRQKPEAKGLLVKAKRSTFNYTLPTMTHKPQPQVVMMKDFADSPGAGSSGEGERQDGRTKEDLEKESTYLFRPGMLPAYRQMFYQLCDLHDPRIQALVHENDGKETTCMEKDGWCLPNTKAKLRDIISAEVSKISKMKHKDKKGRGVRSGAGPDVRGEEEEEDDDDNDEDDDDDMSDSEVDPDQQVAQDSDNEMETEMLEFL
ncbi:general transcription factor 3C polypeptide 5-like isoform X1 [Branchiostoma floridae]|uniref:General transcription factor 3C polypeptide 5-like isoform X1 n=1 Tax=Branchiostoma floridae TaxID=7739 RepID=A0A9J7MZ96_BRAFL|nr:general transcription factor 3C polypeptide 5-like isoform X1 [Branchiostoma floridae]